MYYLISYFVLPQRDKQIQITPGQFSFNSKVVSHLFVVKNQSEFFTFIQFQILIIVHKTISITLINISGHFFTSAKAHISKLTVRQSVLTLFLDLKEKATSLRRSEQNAFTTHSFVNSSGLILTK